jgi:hypothetical protein
LHGQFGHAFGSLATFRVQGPKNLDLLRSLWAVAVSRDAATAHTLGIDVKQNVRHGSKADVEATFSDVCFAPDCVEKLKNRRAPKIAQM